MKLSKTSRFPRRNGIDSAAFCNKGTAVVVDLNTRPLQQCVPFALVSVEGRRASTVVVMGEDPLARILGDKVTGRAVAISIDHRWIMIV